MTKAVAAAALLALAGCGGGDEQQTSASRPDRAATRSSETTLPDTTPGTTPATTPRSEATTGPEQQPGGAGDEEPARSQALFTGRDGRVQPRVVRVPPFISVQVRLRSADGRPYYLVIAGRKLVAGKSLTLDGLRTGAAYEGRSGDGGGVRIEASAEPGP